MIITIAWLISAILQATTADEFNCSLIPRLFWPEDPASAYSDTPVPSCSSRMRAFFAAMDWGEPELPTYRLRLLSIIDQSNLLEAYLSSPEHRTQFRRALAVTRPADGASSESLLGADEDYPSLGLDLEMYGPLFWHLTQNSRGFPKRIFRYFLAEHSPENLGALVYKSLVLVSMFGQQINEEQLDRKFIDFCATSVLQAFVGNASRRATQWQTVCSAHSPFEALFSGPTAPFEFLEILRVQDERGLATLFGPEASDEDVARVRIVPVELFVRGRSLCLHLRLQSACDETLERVRSLGDAVSNHSLARMRANRAEVAWRVESALADASFTLTTLRLQGVLPFELEFLTDPDSRASELVYFRVLASLEKNLVWSSARVVALWRPLRRFVEAETAEMASAELLVAAHSNKFSNLLAAMRTVASRRRVRLDERRLLGDSFADRTRMLDFVLTAVHQTGLNYERLLTQAEAFFDGQTATSTADAELDAFLATHASLVEMGAEDQCCVCLESFDETGRAVTICEGAFGKHRMCESCFRRVARNRPAILCPLCRASVSIHS